MTRFDKEVKNTMNLFKPLVVISSNGISIPHILRNTFTHFSSGLTKFL